MIHRDKTKKEDKCWSLINMMNSMYMLSEALTPCRNIRGLIFLQQLKRHTVSPAGTACLQNTSTDFYDVLISGACWELGRWAPVKAQMKNRRVFISNVLFHHPSITLRWWKAARYASGERLTLSDLNSSDLLTETDSQRLLEGAPGSSTSTHTQRKRRVLPVIYNSCVLI